MFSLLILHRLTIDEFNFSSVAIQLQSSPVYWCSLFFVEMRRSRHSTWKQERHRYDWTQLKLLPFISHREIRNKSTKTGEFRRCIERQLCASSKQWKFHSCSMAKMPRQTDRSMVTLTFTSNLPFHSMNNSFHQRCQWFHQIKHRRENIKVNFCSTEKRLVDFSLLHIRNRRATN